MPPEPATTRPPAPAPVPELSHRLAAMLRAGLTPRSDVAPDRLVRPGLELLECIGEGGSGRVYLAEETSPLRRTVAVKRLHPEHARSDASAWFARQCEALARLDHPHVARILESGRDPAGVPYFSMELVDGPSLLVFCDRRRLDSTARLHLFLGICRAVHHAHARGVLHGDLKPDNILVATSEDGTPVPKIVDFGSPGRPRRGFGTPGYASPEQYGGSRPPDPRADVHALGVILVELLAIPGASLPRDLEWIAAKAAAPVPEDRYPSVAELADDVECWLASRPVAAAPPDVGPWYWTGKWLRRSRRPLLVSGLAIAGMVAAASAFLSRSRAPDAAGKPEEGPRLLARQESERAGIARNLADAARLQTLGRYDDAKRVLQTAGSLAARLPPEDLGTRLEVQRALARLYLLHRQPDDARPILESIAARSDAEPDAWESRLDLIRLHLETRRFGQAESVAAATLAAAVRYFPTNHPIRHRALHLMGRVHVEFFRYQQAHEALSQAAEGFRRHYGPDASETRQVLGDLAEVVQVLRDQERLPKESAPGP